MEHPAEGPAFSVRALARAVKVSPAKIGHLLTGARATCDHLTANAIAEVLGVRTGQLFRSVLSTESMDSTRDGAA